MSAKPFTVDEVRAATALATGLLVPDDEGPDMRGERALWLLREVRRIRERIAESARCQG